MKASMGLMGSRSRSRRASRASRSCSLKRLSWARGADEAAGAASGRARGRAARARSSAAQGGQDLLGPAQHRLGHAGQTRHVDAVALVAAAGADGVQEDDPPLPLLDLQLQVDQAGQVVLQLGQLVVVGGEDGARPRPRRRAQELGDGPGQGQAVVGGGAAADLVQDHQAAPGHLVQDVGGLAHLHEEGGLAPGQVVAGADAGEDAVGDADAAPRPPARSCRPGPSA